jgi:hypothetical protein
MKTRKRRTKRIKKSLKDFLMDEKGTLTIREAIKRATKKFSKKKREESREKRKHQKT